MTNVAELFCSQFNRYNTSQLLPSRISPPVLSRAAKTGNRSDRLWRRCVRVNVQRKPKNCLTSTGGSLGGRRGAPCAGCATPSTPLSLLPLHAQEKCPARGARRAAANQKRAITQRCLHTACNKQSNAVGHVSVFASLVKLR